MAGSTINGGISTSANGAIVSCIPVAEVSGPMALGRVSTYGPGTSPQTLNPPAAQINIVAAGAFTFTGLAAGTYRLAISNLPSGVFVQLQTNIVQVDGSSTYAI